MAPGLCPSALSRRTYLIFRMDNRSAAIVPSPWFVFARLQGRLVDGLMTQLSSVLHPPQLRDVPHVPEWQCHIPEMALPLAPERPFHFDRNDPSTWAGIRSRRVDSNPQPPGYQAGPVGAVFHKPPRDLQDPVVVRGYRSRSARSYDRFLLVVQTRQRPSRHVVPRRTPIGWTSNTWTMLVGDDMAIRAEGGTKYPLVG